MSGKETNLLMNCSNLTDYLKTLDPDRMHRLFTHPATCLAVFRELPNLAQLFVMRLIYVEQAVPKAVVSSWVTGPLKEQERSSSEILSSLNIWTSDITQGGMQAWKLDQTFKHNLKMALMGGGHPWILTPMTSVDPNRRDIPYLDSYAQERWDTILHYMVGSNQQEGISLDAVRVLIFAGLIVVAESGSQNSASTPSITRSGFQFLLMDTPSQVWYFILQYLNQLERLDGSLELSECLNFLFQLSFAELGKDYSTSGLSRNLLTFLQHLREFGLVKQKTRSSGRFYPTRLALNIASGQKKSLMERRSQGFIFVETNYRIYAYPNSDLQIALIGLFAEVLYRFPNLTVAVITRASIRQALKGGITASQIVRFLKMHAHPNQVKTGGSDVIPPTIIDQIYLWEKERDRFEFSEGVLYNQFLSQSDFETVKKYAESLNVCVWANSRNRTVVVSKEGHDSVKQYWRRVSRGGS